VTDTSLRMGQYQLTRTIFNLTRVELMEPNGNAWANSQVWIGWGSYRSLQRPGDRVEGVSFGRHWIERSSSPGRIAVR
jgi:hypothetical protein